MSIPLRTIRPGDLVNVQGYEFRVISAWPAGLPGVVHFQGELTDAPVNEYIRNTGYARGVYSVQHATL